MPYRNPVILGILYFLTSPVYAQSTLPEGEGRDIVEDVCSTCHGLINITDSKRTHEQWQYVVSTMIAQGAPLEDYEIKTVVDYLSRNFGKDSKLLPE